MAGCALHLNCGETVVHRLLHARLLRLSIGWMLIGVGAVITPTPVPLGALLVLAGLCLVARDNRRLRGAIRHLRGRFPRLSARVHVLRDRLPALLRRVVETTDPRRRPRFRARGKAAGGEPV